MTLADRILALLLEHGPVSACRIAVEMRRRKAVVLAALRQDARFRNEGKGRASTWSVAAVPPLDPREAAIRWDCDPETAEEILFGAGGFVERGFVARLNGNGRVVVTERGREAAALVESLA